jgi:dTDP-4-dehydrorhamnose reductase
VGCIAELAESNGARLIHVSTDYVFDGKASTPYPEDSPINPLGVYGRSKAAGERLALSRCSRSYITRTSWLFGPHGKNFVFTMLKLMKEREILKVVSDQVGSPTYTGHLAQAISTIIQADSQEYGIYHFANEGQCSWFDFAREICNLARKRGLISRSCTIQSCGTNDYPTKAKRPPYSVLSKAKIKRVFGVTIPSWQSALSAFFDRLVEEKML